MSSDGAKEYTISGVAALVKFHASEADNELEPHILIDDTTTAIDERSSVIRVIRIPSRNSVI